MARTQSSNRVQATNRSQASSRIQVRDFGGASYKFDSSNQKITYPIAWDVNNSFACAVVINNHRITASNQNIVSQADGSGTGRIILCLRMTGKLSTFIDGSFHDSSIYVPLNEWVMVACVFDKIGGTIKYYMGNFDRSTWTIDSTVNVTVASNNGDIIIGQSKTAGGQLERCEISELLITQLSSTLNIDTTLQNYFQHNIAGSGTTKLFSDFSEGTGTTIGNSSGSNGTASSSSWTTNRPLINRSQV